VVADAKLALSRERRARHRVKVAGCEADTRHLAR
jgi:hypothetical protein